MAAHNDKSRTAFTPYIGLFLLTVALSALVLFSIQEYRTLNKFLSRDAISIMAAVTTVITFVLIPVSWSIGWVRARRVLKKHSQRFRSDRYINWAYFLFLAIGAYCALVILWTSALKDPYPAKKGQPLESSLLQSYTGLWLEYSEDVGLKFSTCSDGPYQGNCYQYLSFEVEEGELETIITHQKMHPNETPANQCPTGFCATWWPQSDMATWESYSNFTLHEPQKHSQSVLWYDRSTKRAYMWFSLGPFDL